MPARDLEWQGHSIGMLDNFIGGRDSALPKIRQSPQGLHVIDVCVAGSLLGIQVLFSTTTLYPAMRSRLGRQQVGRVFIRVIKRTGTSEISAISSKLTLLSRILLIGTRTLYSHSSDSIQSRKGIVASSLIGQVSFYLINQAGALSRRCLEQLWFCLRNPSTYIYFDEFVR